MMKTRDIKKVKRKTRRNVKYKREIKKNKERGEGKETAKKIRRKN